MANLLLLYSSRLHPPFPSLLATFDLSLLSAASSSMPSHSLPDELLENIFNNINIEPPKPHTWTLLALVCRRFLPFAQARLYYHLELHSKWRGATESNEGPPRVNNGAVHDDEGASNNDESMEDRATRYWLRKFDRPSRKLLQTFLGRPAFRVYV